MPDERRVAGARRLDHKLITLKGRRGYAAVWAKENTRASLWDAMQRKETYATTGPRMIVRFFGGWDFDAQDAQNRLPAAGRPAIPPTAMS